MTDLDGRPAGARPPGFRRRWVIRVTLGEVLGFTAPAAVGAALATAPAAAAVPALVTAGLVEGTLLGAAQASLLRRLLPDLRTGTAQWLVLQRVAPRSAFWIPVTGAAWAVGLAAFLVVATRVRSADGLG